MTNRNLAYLLSVLGIAAVLAARSIGRVENAWTAKMAAQSVSPGTAGQPRDVDMKTLLELLSHNALSDHEAEFYTPLPPQAATTATATTTAQQKTEDQASPARDP